LVSQNEQKKDNSIYTPGTVIPVKTECIEPNEEGTRTASKKLPGDKSLNVGRWSVSISEDFYGTSINYQMLFGEEIYESGKVKKVWITDIDGDGCRDLLIQAEAEPESAVDIVKIMLMDANYQVRDSMTIDMRDNYSAAVRQTEDRLMITITNILSNEQYAVPLMYSETGKFEMMLYPLTEIMKGFVRNVLKNAENNPKDTEFYIKSIVMGKQKNLVTNDNAGRVTCLTGDSGFTAEDKNGKNLLGLFSSEEFLSKLAFTGIQIFSKFSKEQVINSNAEDSVMIYRNDYRLLKYYINDLGQVYLEAVSSNKDCFTVYYFKAENVKGTKYDPAAIVNDSNYNTASGLRFIAYRPSDLADLPKGALCAEYDKDREYINYHFEKSSEGFFLVPDDAVFPSGDGELTIDISVEIGINKSEKTAKKPIGARIKLAELDDLANLKSFSLKFNFPDGADVTHSFAF